MTLGSVLSGTPKDPGVYALYAGEGRSTYVAYVGATSSIRHRLIEHIVRRDSSVTTGVSAVSIRVELLTKVSWWCLPEFSDPRIRLAAELVAFDVLDPVLRSRAKVGKESRELGTSSEFHARIAAVISGSPSGTLYLASDREFVRLLEALDRRVARLESRASKP